MPWITCQTAAKGLCFLNREARQAVTYYPYSKGEHSFSTTVRQCFLFSGNDNTLRAGGRFRCARGLAPFFILPYEDRILQKRFERLS